MIWRSGRLTQPRFGVRSTMPLLVSSGTGRADADADDLRARDLAPGLRDRPLGQRDETVEHAVAPGLRVGRLALHGVEDDCRLRRRCPRPGSSRQYQCPVRIARRASTPEIPLTAAATRSTDNSSMQR